MCKQILTFGDIEIEKDKLYHYKSPTFFEHVDLEEVLASNKFSCSEKSYKQFFYWLLV